MDWMRIFCFMIRTKSEQRFQLWHYKRLHCFLPLLFSSRISFTFTCTSVGEMKANAKMVVWAYDEEMHCNYLDGKLSTITLTNLWILIEMDIQMTWWLLLSYHPSKISHKMQKIFSNSSLTMWQLWLIFDIASGTTFWSFFPTHFFALNTFHWIGYYL